MQRAAKLKMPSLRCCLLTAGLFIALIPREAMSETRLYHLRVTLRSGERYETISAFDPINYCHAHGGSVIWLRDYSLLYSPQMEVQVLSTWVDRGGDLAGRWPQILKAHALLSSNNHRVLPGEPDRPGGTETRHQE